MTDSNVTGVDLLSDLWTRRDAPAWTLRQWEAALGQARQARLPARLATLFVDRGWMSGVPSGPATYLRNALHASDRQHREVTWEIDQIEHALAGVDTPVLLLKGAAYLMAGLPAARGRLFADIDIMVDRRQLDQAEGALLRAGWVPEKHDAYDQRYYREWMHELPPLKHVQRGTFIDLHHTIAPPTSAYRVDGALLLARAQPLRPGSRLQVLAPEDMVLHSAVHLMQEGEFSGALRDLLDQHDLLQHFGQAPEFWTRLFDRALELGLGQPLAQVLAQVRRITGLAWPAALNGRFEALAPARLRFRLIDRLLGVALRPPHHSCDTWLSPWARWLLYVRSHWVRMPIWLVLPHLVRKAWVRRFAKA